MTKPNDPSNQLPELTAAMLCARNETDRFAASEIQRAADLLNTEPDESGVPVDPIRRSLYMTLLSSRFLLMRQIMCTEELLWYQNHCGQDALPQKAADISPALRRFDGQIEILTAGILKSECGELPAPLYTIVPADRLTFIMLNLLADMLTDAPEYRIFRLNAQKTDSCITLSMHFRIPEEGELPPYQPEQMRFPKENDNLPNSPHSILQRFCDTFGATLMHHSEQNTLRISLTIPAASNLTPHTELHSDHAAYYDGSFNVYHVLLARSLPVEALLGCEMRYF